MATSTIDALFQLAAPRATETARGPEAAPFDPALRQALAPGRQAEQPPSPSSPVDEPEATVAGEAEDHAADRWANETVEGAEKSAPVEDKASAAADENESTADEAEISDAAAAAMAAVEAKAIEHRKDAGPTAAANVVTATDAEQNGVGDEGFTSAETDAAAAAVDAALDGAERFHAESVTGKDDSETNPSMADEGGRSRAVRHEQSTDHAANGAATGVSSTQQPVEAPSEQDSEQGADDVSKDKKPTVGDARAVERGERRSDSNNRVESKQDGQAPLSTAVSEAAAVEAPSGGRPDAQAEAPVAKAEASPAVAAQGSTPRSAAGLEKLVGPREVLPAAAEGTSADDGPPVDRARFVQRVEGALRRAQDRDGRLHVRLSPPELGSLRVEIALQNGVLTAKLEAETTAARNLIMENLPALRERLAQQDVRIEKFDVDVRRDGGGSDSASGGDPGARERSAEQPAWRQEERRARSTAVRADRAVVAPAAKPQANVAGLDVRV